MILNNTGLDRWAAIRQAAAETIAAFEAASGLVAFPPEQGCHPHLDAIADLVPRAFGCENIFPPVCSQIMVTTENDDFFNAGSFQTRSVEQTAFRRAHWIGHAVLKHPAVFADSDGHAVDERAAADSLRGKAGGRPAQPTLECYELEANVFAAELLAPIQIVQEWVAAAPDWTLDDLAAYFGLPRDAMANQLTAALFPGPQETEEDQTDSAAPPPLDPMQEQAAQVQGSAALVVAGPGAGKTRVLTERYRYLVTQCGAKPEQILCLTFANKAAEEMRVRLARMLPDQAGEIQVSTFHSLGLQLLTTYGLPLGLPTRFRTATEVDTFVLLRRRLPDLELEYFGDLVFPTRHLRHLLEAIGRAKSELIGPQEYAEEVRRWHTDVLALPDPEDKRALTERRTLLEKIARFGEVARVYEQYQTWLQEAGLLDYGDLLMQSVRLFEQAEVARKIHDQYRYMLVDEFQDINRASGRLIQALDGGRQVTWAVGDPRQGIFRFQGASPRNLFGFAQDYPDSRVFSLKNNYRSVPDIVSVSAAVAFPAKDQHPEWFAQELVATRTKKDAAEDETEPAVCVARTATLADEYAWMAREIAALQKAGRSLGEIAVLCRTREQAQAISRHFETSGLPTDWGGILQNNPLFKDLMAILSFAAGNPKSLVRLARITEHTLSATDVQTLLRVAQTASLESALSRAQEGTLPEFSKEGQPRAADLLDLYRFLASQPTPWAILTAYLFEWSRWPRAVFTNLTPEGMRARTTLGQVLDLVRDFRHGAEQAAQTVEAFLNWVGLAIESGRLETNTAAPRLPNAIHLLTMHGSKGLQWPVVFLPQLVEDTRRPGEDDLPLPRFVPREHDPLDSDEREEACLLYVALTRAQDRLYLSASRQGRWSTTNREAELHRLLSEEVGWLAEENALVSIEVPSEAPREMPTTFAERTAFPVSPTANGNKGFGWLLEDAIPHSALQMYGDCGLKFLYHYGYRLDDGENRHRLYHKVIRRVMKQTAAVVQGGEEYSDAALCEEFLRLWARVSGQEDREALAQSRLVTRGVRAVQAFRDRLRPGEQVLIDSTPTFMIHDAKVSLRIDELHNDGARWYIRRHQLTRRSKRHARDGFFLGLQLANQGMSLRMPRITLHYLLEDVMEQPGDLVPPPTLGRVMQHKEALATAIDGIRSGQFPPQPTAFKCRHCAFQLICPAS